jgi:hypothetical protein
LYPPILSANLAYNGGWLSNPKTIGTLYGALGMVSFSLTLPATRAAVIHLDPAVPNARLCGT